MVLIIVRKNLINENPMKFVKMPKYQLSLKDLKESVNSLEDKFLTVDELRAF